MDKPAVVLNKRTDGVPKGAVYVGRPTKWGNPYVIGKDGTRQEVVDLYGIWLHEQIHTGQLDLDELRGRDLVCWCAPEACHADLLVVLAND